MDCVRIPLEGAKNVRDLGGIYTKENKITQFHIFIRGSRLTNLTKKDNEILRKYQITDIIDLRGSTNIQKNFISDDKINKDYFKFHYIPLSNTDIEEYVEKNSNKETFDYGEGYFLLLKNKKKVAEIFRVLLNAEGATLFHCTAGKDRTGVITALILGICDVDESDIIANYEVTYTYIKNEEFLQKYEERIRKSEARFMETFIKKIKEQYGSFQNYILSCGIKKEEIEQLKEKFCKDSEY